MKTKINHVRIGLVRDVISVFSRGGAHNFDRLPWGRGGGQNIKKIKVCRHKHKKVTIFQIQGEANAPFPPHPQMTPLDL